MKHLIQVCVIIEQFTNLIVLSDHTLGLIGGGKGGYMKGSRMWVYNRKQEKYLKKILFECAPQVDGNNNE